MNHEWHVPNRLEDILSFWMHLTRSWTRPTTLPIYRLICGHASL